MPTTAFRDESFQRTLYTNYVNKEGVEKADTYSARPSYSEHQTGLSIDLKNIALSNVRLTDENYEYLRKAKEWIQSIEDRLIIFDSGLSARILYKTTIPILQKLGKIEEIDGREIYIPNNPNQKVIGVIDHALLEMAL